MEEVEEDEKVTVSMHLLLCHELSLGVKLCLVRWCSCPQL